jgi:hypothetical protein
MIGISVESERRRVELAVYVMNQALESVYKALMTRSMKLEEEFFSKK